MEQRTLKVGIIGQGRSGRDIHGNLLKQIPDYYEITAVADSIPERRTRAEQEYGCRAYETWQEMVENEQLDLVVNATVSHLHYPISLELLERGFHVLCEKPLAKTPEEVDSLIAASRQSGKLIAIFQQRSYQPAFMKIREIIESGVLGRIVQIDFALNGFSRRWDWQTLQSNNGGSLMNTGPHPVDQALQLFGGNEMPQITCIMDRANTFGDAEDYVKLLMRGPGKPTIDLEISSCSAYSREQFIVHGTNGGLHGNTKQLEWRYFKPEEAPVQKLEREPLFKADGTPAYCSEQLVWHTDQWEMSLPGKGELFPYMTEQLYMMLYRSIVNGDPLEVTPEQVRLQMQVMEECRRQNPQIYA